MFLLADSGSTKTDWSLTDGKNILRRIGTPGINPFFQSEEEITHDIILHLLPKLEGNIPNNVYFYGAGCSPEKVPIVKRALQYALNMSPQSIDVHSDMLAAARSMCGHEPGIVGILGTGSNSCHYDGREIVANVSPLGFILGDEGSGAVLGRILIGNLLKNQMPINLKKEFLNHYQLTPADIIDRVYRKPFPNRFLASFAPFLSAHLQEPSVQTLLKENFRSFIRRNIMQYPYKELPVHFCGSIAHIFREQLLQAATEEHVQVKSIEQSPMEGLIKYHYIKV